jgi:hypothetical protein
MSSHLNDINLASSTRATSSSVVTYDSTTIHTVAMADTFRSIGYPAKVRYLVNRAGRPAGSTRSTSSALGACPASRRVGRHARRPVNEACVRPRQPRFGDHEGRDARRAGSSTPAG